MQSKKLEISLLHAKLSNFQQKLKKALIVIENALNNMQNPYIAFSGGIDSTAVLYLVRTINPDVRAVFGHE